MRDVLNILIEPGKYAVYQSTTEGLQIDKIRKITNCGATFMCGLNRPANKILMIDAQMKYARDKYPEFFL